MRVAFRWHIVVVVAAHEEERILQIGKSRSEAVALSLILKPEADAFDVALEERRETLLVGDRGHAVEHVRGAQDLEFVRRPRSSGEALPRGGGGHFLEEKKAASKKNALGAHEHGVGAAPFELLCGRPSGRGRLQRGKRGR